MIAASPSATVKVGLIAPHGLLGQAWAGLLSQTPGVQLMLLARAELNLTNPGNFERVLGECDFDWLINCAAYTAVDDCEVQGDLAFLVNGAAPGILARIAARRGARMLHFSTDFVFDGQSGVPYTEEHPTHPISVYGKSKLAGELAVQEADSQHLVVRLSWLFGRGRASFPEWIVSKARQADQIEVVGDKFACPTHAESTAAALLPWITGPETLPGGVLHYANQPGCAWSEYAEGVLSIARELGLPLQAQSIVPVPLSSLHGLTAPRPLYSVMDTGKYQSLVGKPPRDWRTALQEHLHYYQI